MLRYRISFMKRETMPIFVLLKRNSGVEKKKDRSEDIKPMKEKISNTVKKKLIAPKPKS